MKYVWFSLLVSSLSAVTFDELVTIHKVTEAEMHTINAPHTGSLVYNTTENTVFFYTGSSWKKLKSDGSETVISAGNQVVTTGNGSTATPYIIGK